MQNGRYVFQVGEERTTLEGGGLIFLPRGRPHTWAQLSDTGRMLFMFTPAGDMEEYFRALSQLRGPLPLAEERALFAAHGMELLGPPLDLEDNDVRGCREKPPGLHRLGSEAFNLGVHAREKAGGCLAFLRCRLQERRGSLCVRTRSGFGDETGV